MLQPSSPRLAHVCGPLLGLILLLMGAQAALAQTNAKTYNGKDGVVITKITPRSNAEIPFPAADFVIYLEIRAKIVTTPNGSIKLDFYRYSRQRMHLVRLTPTMQRPIHVTSEPETWLVQSTPLTISSAEPDEQIYVKANLLNDKGKVVSWSESFNPLRGQVTVKAGANAASRDEVKALPGTTPINTRLAASGLATFTIRLRYGVKSARRGVINVEFGEVNDIRKGSPWSVSVVEVPAGSGEIEIHRTFQLVPSLKGTQMAIGIALRTNPLSGAVVHFELQPYPIGM